MSADTISLQDAADRLGVHYMTAYRYVRTGRLQAVKSGGQWQVHAADIDAFGSSAEPERAPRTEVYPRLIESRLMAGDEAGAMQLLEDAMAAGAAPDEAYIDLLGEALVSVGVRWANGEISIADEHVATATSTRVISRMGPGLSKRGRSRGTVLLAGVSGDHHALPTAMLRDLLRHRNFDVIDLGAHTPAASIVDRATQIPDLIAVGLAATRTENDGVIGTTLEHLDQSLSVPVALGGAAIRDAPHARWLGPCVPTHSTRDALDTFEQIQQAASQAS
jgi:excisionase family DNA binding protein